MKTEDNDTTWFQCGAILASIGALLSACALTGCPRSGVIDRSPTSTEAAAIAAVSTCVVLEQDTRARMTLADGSVVIVEAYKYPLKMKKLEAGHDR